MNNKNLIRESFDAYRYAIEHGIIPADLTTWDDKYKERMQKIAGIIHEIGSDVESVINEE